MQEDFMLTAPDGAKIYGMLNGMAKKSDRLVIISHGLTGNPKEYLHQIAWRRFVSYGYDVARFYYYRDEDGARRLKDCTLDVHATDLNAVVAHFSGVYRKVFIAGHSYGGLTMVVGKPPATAYSFWDASVAPSWWKEAGEIANTEIYRIDWGMDQQISRALYEEARDWTVEKTQNLAASIQAPSQVILAGKDGNYEARKLLFDALKTQKDLVVIEDADHTFSLGDTAEQLAQETLRWFDNF